MVDSDENKQEITFATMAVAPFWVDATLLLVESLRAFGGRLSDQPVIVLVPTISKPLPDQALNRLQNLNAKLISFELPDSAARFPLGLLPYGAAAAEQHAREKAYRLAWLVPDTFIVQEPMAFLIPPEKRLAYRPVHHSNIGAPYDEPPDTFWQTVYRHCEVAEERMFPMQTCTRDKVLRPYINAGVLVTIPEDGFLSAWSGLFERAYQHPDFLPFFEQQRYAVFMHQAVLSALAVKRYSPNELDELPEMVNYPAHLHHEYPKAYRPRALNELITVRYEDADEMAKWLEQIEVAPEMRAWLESRWQETEKTSHPD